MNQIKTEENSRALIENIRDTMRRKNKKQVHIARRLQLQRQTVHKMLNGSRTITAIELKEIADFLEVSADALLAVPQREEEKDILQSLAEQAATLEAAEQIQAVDTIIDLYLGQWEKEVQS